VICQMGGLGNVRSTIAKESIYGQVAAPNSFETFTLS
jgi:hypothetical protein